MIQVLVVEDDDAILKLITRDLKQEGYQVTTSSDGAEGFEKAKSLQPDLIILDLMLPTMSGYDLCRNLRRDGSDVPVIMLTARGQEPEKVLGLEQGADDYITKPYGSMELLARVRALLRRHKRVMLKTEKVVFDDVKVDFQRMEATKNGKPIHLTTKEFHMLELLLRHRGRVVSRHQFLEEIWGYEEETSTRMVDNRLVSLRQKLNPNNPEAYIIGVYGAGYKFIL